MKFRRFGQWVLASAVSLTLGVGLAACGGGTSDFLYLTASKNNPGQVAVFKVNYQSGTLTALQTPVYPAGRNPVAEALSPDGKTLYVVNHDDNTIIQFAIGTDGKLYPQHTYNTPGTFPTSTVINSAGTFLYVVDNYQPGFTDSVPGLGAVVVFPVASDGSLGTPVVNASVTPNVAYFPVGLNPSAVAVVPAGSYLYVLNKGNDVNIVGDSALCQANAANCATISAFSTSSTGVLTPVPVSSACNGAVCAGSAPAAITVNPTGGFVYVTDSSLNKLFTYSVTASGSLAQAATASVGNIPDSVTTDAAGDYLYVANYFDNNVSTFAISSTAGATTAGIPSDTGKTVATGTGPTCVVVEPSLQRYLYTSNFLSSTVSGFQIDGASGALTPIQNTPYPLPGGAGQPTCAAVVKHGKHNTAPAA